MSDFESKKTLVLVGYGPAMADCILTKFTNEGYKVAILARNKDRLDEVANKHKQQGQEVVGYSINLAQPETLGQVYDQIIADFGGSITGVIYNATSFGQGCYEYSVEQLTATANINVVSLHVTFNHFLAHWKKTNAAGRFALTGGGLSRNGAWSVGFSAQAGAAAKAYFKNFAESADATFANDNIRTVCVTVAGLVYGGDTVKMEDPNPEASQKFRAKVGDSFYGAIANAPDTLSPEVFVAPDN
jgi:NAD(P)-dependent dehydrogenase (short-subunit alcohol dehydrogenase family)